MKGSDCIGKPKPAHGRCVTRAEKEKITKTKRNRKRKNREANRDELPADATVQPAAQTTPIPTQAKPNKNKVTKNVERPRSQGKKKGFVIKDVNEKDSQPKDQPKTTTTRSAKGEKKSFQIKKIEQ